LKLGKWSEEEIEQRALEKLDILGLKDQALKKANKLSGGQQQRAAIARALINDPEIIFGDEPSGNLDSRNTEIVLGILKDLKQQFNQTILIVTHDMSLAAQTDRKITFKDGAILEDIYLAV
jgi:lipoprotein-releasing system ATP-binding protein